MTVQYGYCPVCKREREILPAPALGNCAHCYNHTLKIEWVRYPEGDLRIKRGDDFAADAWKSQDGRIWLVAVGVNPN